jgi:hypothetical protein
MANIVNLLKPILFAFLESKQVKDLVIALLEAYAKSTKNNIDNTIVSIVKTKLFD